jgi:hypothetical protein
VGDRRRELRLDDQVEEELDDRYLEVAELDDHLDLNAVAAEDVEQKAQELLLPQAQRRLQVLEEFAEQHRFAVQEQMQQQVLP